MKPHVVKLMAVAAMAQSLADDAAAGRLWPGDFSSRLAAIQEELTNALRLSGER